MGATGLNSHGQLGTGVDDTSTRTSPTRVFLKAPSNHCSLVRVAAIATGALHTVFVTVAGDVYTCGSNARGQLGHRHGGVCGVAKPIHWPAASSMSAPDASRGVQSSTAGAAHTLLLRRNVSGGSWWGRGEIGRDGEVHCVRRCLEVPF